MRPCVFTDEISQDLEHALEVAAEFGVRTLELRGVWGKGIAEHPDQEVARIRDLLAARGFAVASIALGFFKCDLPGYAVKGPQDEAAAAATVRRHIAMLHRGVELCRRFEAAVVRGFNFWRPLRQSAGLEPDPAQPNRHLREADLPPEVRQRILEQFAEPVRILEAAGVTLGLENEHGCGVGRGDETARFIEDLGSAHVGVTWDPGNAFMAGETPYPDGYAHVRPHLVHVHVKDARVEPETGKARWCVMGEGQIDFVGQFRALVEDAYQGAVSLETHYSPPGGTREDGTRLCLPAMMDLLRRAGWQGG